MGLKLRWSRGPGEWVTRSLLNVTGRGEVGESGPLCYEDLIQEDDNLPEGLAEIV